ncbi:MAG TPA: hypothetical protein VG941_02790 [Candidatus Paceibacterota bacterium]|nr:hypothetical protein [Candidatus Paceibacterota bacterium]
MKSFFSKAVAVGVGILPIAVSAATGSLPAGNPITFDFIDNLAATLLNFIIGLAGVVMVGSIVVSGIMITTSRENPMRFKSGIAALKTAVWGSFVVLGVGVIINTIWALVTRDFFCQVSLLGVCIFN